MPLRFTKRELEFVAFLLAKDAMCSSVSNPEQAWELAAKAGPARVVGFRDFDVERVKELWRKIDDNIPKT